MVRKTKTLSALVERQLPEFISSEYPLFVKFVQKYYEQLENVGGPLDIISNISHYADIDNYENKILTQQTTLTSQISNSSTTINVVDTSSFPEENGYILIGDEAIFYKSKTATSFVDCYRNVNTTTKLGDLYHKSDVKTVRSDEVGKGQEHQPNSVILNVSNLFLYAFVRNFESQYLSAFPEENLKSSVDKKTLIKNIKNFYQAKGTDQSIKFIFNSIVSADPFDIPSVYYPKDKTLKPSTGSWINKFAIKAKLVSGDIQKLIGQKIYQQDGENYSFAYVDNVYPLGEKDGDDIYEITLVRDNVVGEFTIAAKTFLTKNISSSSTTGNLINVYSTLGWNKNFGEILIGNEIIKFDDKSVNQFRIESRQSPTAYTVNTPVYSTNFIIGEYIENNSKNVVKLIPFGVLYDIGVKNGQPGSSVDDVIQIDDSGFTSNDTKIFDKFTGLLRWIINENNTSPSLPQQPTVQSSLSEVLSNVSAVFEDDQYYYIASSGFPSYEIGPFSTLTSPQDQKHLKIIKKNPVTTTEVNKTNENDVGILVNGVPIYSYKDEEVVKFGEVISVKVEKQGLNYTVPPYVIFEESIGKTASARAILSGQVVERIEIVDGGTSYTKNPEVTITSGRNAVVNAVVTSGKVTSLVIVNPGEYYSAPPIIKITDLTGRGKYAEYNSVISSDGKLVGFELLNEGKSYTQENIVVEIIPQGSGATAVADVREWRKNRYEKLKNKIDSNNGYYFNNRDVSYGYGYAHIANPKKLRIGLGDNLNNTGSIPSTKVHSKILGFAYDGNPIYGPWAYSNPTDAASSIVMMTSSYVLNSTRPNGPSVTEYPLGSFIQDYSYVHRSGLLDENNGRFCVTPEYPNGTYAYFMTINNGPNSTTEGSPSFPYFVGENFYSIPVDFNYNKLTSQKDLPKNVTRLRTQLTPNNGIDSFATISSITTGGISNIESVSSPNIFNVGNQVYIDNSETDGSGAQGIISEIKGKSVVSLESKIAKIVKVQTENNCYLFDGSTITQEVSNASGVVIGNVFDDNEFVIKTTNGVFNTTNELNSSIIVNNLVLDAKSSYTKGSIVTFTNGNQVPIEKVSGNFLEVSNNPYQNGDTISFNNAFGNIQANRIYYVRSRENFRFRLSSTATGSLITIANTNSPGSISFSEKARGEVIDSTENTNAVKVKVTQGDFSPSNNFYLRSSSISDSIGSEVILKNNLSQDIKVLEYNDKVALVRTQTEHNLSVNDEVFVDVNPNDNLSTTTYFVRKRIYQDLTLSSPEYSGLILDSGVGSGRILNSGDAYANGGNQTYTNVELIFSDQTKCRDANGNIVGASSQFAVLGKPGNSNNARATISVASGKVTSVNITTKGVGYKRGDLLSVSNSSLQRSGSSTSTRFLLFEVIHVGFATGETTLNLSSVDNLSENDYLTVNDEVVKISSVDKPNSSVSVVRSQFETTQSDHDNNSVVTFYRKVYNFSPGYSINNATVLSYESSSQKLTVVYPIGSDLESLPYLNLSSIIRDQSNPSKIITVKEFEFPSYKFEFSKDQNTWQKNPIIEIQKNYKYKFDTSSPTLLGSYFEISPSLNYNILVTETQKSSALPGNSGSFVTIKLGYGDLISTNLLGNKVQVNYSNYYYFDKSGIVSADKSYLKLIQDPLEGRKTVTYISPTYFCYDLDSYGQYDGTGSISYVTSSTSASGQINKVKVTNPGNNYKKIPSVYGFAVSPANEAVVDVIWNTNNKNIEEIKIINPGKGYVSPKVLVIGDGVGSSFKVNVSNGGAIDGIIVLSKGKNYTKKPIVKIVESSVVSYCESFNIGVPKTIKLSYNGSNFYNDTSTTRKITSSVFLSVKGYTDSSFVGGDEITQYDGSLLIAKGIVSLDGWKSGSNVLKISKVLFGKFKEGLPITGKLKNGTAEVVKVFTSILEPSIKSYYDNLGYYSSNTGKIGESEHRLADSYFYQDYSYVIKSKTPIDVWRKLIQQTVHPSGFKLFGELEINSQSVNTISSIQNSDIISIIQLWDPDKNKITVESTKFNSVKSSIVDINTAVVKGLGSAIIPAFSNNEITAYEIVLEQQFNGYFNQSGNRVGNTVFTMKIKGSNTLLTVSNIYNLLLTLDGVLLEPNKDFTVNGSTLTFVEAPLGYRDSKGFSVSLANYKKGIDTPPQIFVGRYLKFKDSVKNTNTFKKIKDISRNTNGRYLDAANLIESNKDFILDESIGYLKSKVTAGINEEYYVEILESYIDAVIHDIRYGGNSDVINFTKFITNTAESKRLRNFETIFNISGQQVNSVSTNGSITVAVTQSGRIYTTGNAFSPYTWTQRTYTNPTTILNRVVFINNIFVILGKGIILTSSNGTSWTVVSRHNDDLLSAAYSDTEGYIAVGQDRIYYTSFDGVTWNSNEIYELNVLDTDYPVLNDNGLISTISLNDVISYNDIFIVAGDSGNFYITEDYNTWKIVETSFYYGDIISIIKNSNTLIAVTENGYILKSTNGYNWSAYEMIPDVSKDYIVSGIVYAGNEYILTATSSSTLKTNIYGSLNAEIWYPMTDFVVSPVLTENLSRPIYVNGSLYVGSNNGKIYKAINPNLSGTIPGTTIDLLKYSRNLMALSARNWDVVIEFAKTVNNSSVVTIGSTANIAVGMRVVGKGIPTATFVKEIINDTQFRLGNKDRTSNKNATFTSTATQSTLLYFSLNSLGNDPGHTRDTGAFLDAARQIEKNKEFIKEETYGWAIATYPQLLTTPGIDITKCKRDIGYLIDAFVYDLKFGGNTKIIEVGESYYTGTQLAFINNQLTESIETFRKVTEYAKLAMRNWGGSSYVREFTNPGTFNGETIVGVVKNSTIRVAVTKSGKIYTSPVSSSSWSQRSYTSPVREFNFIQYLNDTFWILAKGAVLYSFNGTTWFVRTLGGNDSPNHLAFTQNSGYVLACDNRVYYTSFDGNVWNYNEIYDVNPLDEDYPYLTEEGNYIITDLNHVIYPSFNTSCIIGGDNGRFYVSNNLNDWDIIITSEFYGDIVSITEVSGVLLAVTSNGYSLRSTDGRNWTKYNITSESQRDYRISGHVWVENEYIAVGSYSSALSTSIFGSLDGQTWYPLTTTDFSISPDLTQTFTRPTYFSGDAILVGTEQGKVLRARVPLYEKQYTNLDYVRDPNIRVDRVIPTELSCSGVSTALDNYFQILNTILTQGINKVPVSLEYENPTGAFTPLSPYPNYNIIQDYTYPECNDVISAIFTLFDVIAQGYSNVTLPSYFDGKNTVFSLYYDDGSEVSLQPFENLVVGLDGVLQRAGITPVIPINRSYYINRTTVPNQIVFVEPPKSFGNINYQKFFAYAIGKYDLLTIIKKTNKTTGPFNIISSLTKRTTIVSDDRYVLVFVDGILQRRNESYTINNSLIYFDEPLDPSSTVYMMYWYGEDYDKTLQLYGQYKPDAIYQPTEFDSTPLNAKYDIFLGDLIRLEGEKEFRKVLSDPYNFEKTEYRTQDETNVSYSAEVKVTNYNDDAFGNGLDIQAFVENGKVTSLLWNKKDYSISYPQPNNYGYENTPILTFVSQPEYDTTGTIITHPTGGGAKGYAVMAGGEVIDIVLLDGGSGYVVPPKVLITKKFDVYRSNTRKNPTEIYLNFQFGPVETEGLITSSICSLILATVVGSPQITSLPVVSPAVPVKENFEITINVQPDSEIVSESTVHPAPEIILIIPSESNAGEVEFVHDTYIESTSIINTLFDDVSIVTISEITQEIVSTQQSGIVEYITPFSDSDYLLGQYGSTFGTYDEFQLYDFGFARVSDMEQTIETFTLYHPTVTLEDFSDRLNTFIDGTGKYLDAVTPSINEYGGILDSSITETDTIIYIPNTERFPDSGIILVGDEVVKYTSKLSDRFLNCTRGYFGTIAKPHDAGDYLRTYRIEFKIPVYQNNADNFYNILVDTRESDPDMFRIYSNDVYTRNGSFSLI